MRSKEETLEQAVIELPTSAKTLYIIGNGFDLYHELDTSYSSFGLFLKENHYEIYEYFIKYFGLPELDEKDKESFQDPLWSHFEESLATLNIEEVLDDHIDFIAKPFSDSFRDGDWHTIEVMVCDIRDALTIKMVDSFKSFINQVKYPLLIENKKLKIESESIFLNFNYTHTLKYFYKIPSNNILFIHNNGDSKEPLILGHGINPDKFENENDKPPIGLTREQLIDWHETRSDRYDLSIERGKITLMEYFKKSFKSTSLILKNHAEFFNSLGNISKVIILGHSLSEIDRPYISKIICSTNADAKWLVSFHKPEEINIRKKRLIELGLKEEQISMIKISDLTKNKQH